MYIVREDKVEMLKEKYKMSYVSNVTGITQGYLSQILNGKNCSRKTALLITKAIDERLFIEDLFELNYEV